MKQQLQEQGIICLSQIMSPLWNGASDKYKYLTTLAGRLVDCLNSLRYEDEQYAIKLFKQEFYKYVLQYAEENEMKKIEQYFPLAFEE